ncbi:ThuA domain-containing protein [Rubinisphaera italica]|nr:ThuA domain-containing protein [Rubinisphaera italica]
MMKPEIPLSILALFFVLAISWTAPVQAKEIPKTKILMLTESKGFTHGSVRRNDGKLATAEVAMIQLGQKTGLFDVDCTQNSAADFTKENLEKYDIVMFYTTGELPIAPEDRDYFINDWLKQKGHGFIGFHSAADTYRTNDPKKNEEFRWYWDMCGGTFNGHPWGAGTTVTMTVHDPEHPVMQPFGKVFVHQDEIYQYVNWQPEKVRVLMSLDMANCKPSKPYHVPVAWVKSWGDGKVYFNNLGHRDETWTNAAFLKSVENAVKWMRGGLEGSTEPNPEVSAAEEEKAKAAAKE